MMAETLPTKPLTDMVQRHRADYELLEKIANQHLNTETGVQLEALLKLIGARAGREWVIREYGRTRNVTVSILSDKEDVRFVFFSTKGSEK